MPHVDLLGTPDGTLFAAVPQHPKCGKGTSATRHIARQVIRQRDQPQCNDPAANWSERAVVVGTAAREHAADHPLNLLQNAFTDVTLAPPG